MNIHEEFNYRIDSDKGYDNEKLANDLIEIAKKHLPKQFVISGVSVSLRDYIATECMKSEIIAWNKEMSNEYRAKLLEDIIERYGNIKVNDAIALMSYEMADAMLSARSNER